MKKLVLCSLLVLLGIGLMPVDGLRAQSPSAAAAAVPSPGLGQGQVVRLLRAARPLLEAQAGFPVGLGQLLNGYVQGWVQIQWQGRNVEG